MRPGRTDTACHRSEVCRRPANKRFRTQRRTNTRRPQDTRQLPRSIAPECMPFPPERWSATRCTSGPESCLGSWLRLRCPSRRCRRSPLRRCRPTHCRGFRRRTRRWRCRHHCRPSRQCHRPSRRSNTPSVQRSKSRHQQLSTGSSRGRSFRLMTERPSSLAAAFRFVHLRPRCNLLLCESVFLARRHS